MRRNIVRLTESQLHRVIKESVKRILREGTEGDNTINSPEDGNYLYRIGIWCGSGYVLNTYDVYAFDEEDALEKVVAWAETNDQSILQDENAESYRQELANDECDGDINAAEEHPYFQDTFMYVDATMEGASQPHYIYSENLHISRV